MGDIAVFKSILVGGISKEDLINKLVERGIKFNKYAHILFEHKSFVIVEKPERVNLVKIRVDELGINTSAVFAEIVARAEDLGLKLCPLSLGAFLRLEYLDQHEGPYLTVASAKPENDETFPCGFYLRNNENSLWLRGYCASDDYEWPIESEFIFLK